ncbi:FAD:protein FMN transferase [Aestuariibaculum sediminum]|uniref:FAD:protein FMN transferase n=1 Tax=Aestuariibaculum sediminum TaxID=2770637 RepID=A0A8J6U8Y8_9FLAO|nr:FAD:protein FMN transferase [Aestuariibaculum sediminum]MBD0833653.1 FAD:protein FMN transferase [Aestuariibaculum sediminum]
MFGTYYRFQIDSNKDFSKQIDSIFTEIDKAANSYVERSEISAFNKKGILKKPSLTFLNMLTQAKKYNQISNGYFSPSLYPLIKFWSKDLENKSKIDSVAIDSILKLTSFNNLVFDVNMVSALKKGVEIDLSAMGEGYALDAIASILDKAKVSNYMVEVGGEMKCKGNNPNGKTWQVGIENPLIPVSQRGDSLMKIVKLKNKALSTSGNYRKFYKDKLGNKYAHIIDSKTGYTIKCSLLSVSILSQSSTKADALATACMSMGIDKAMTFIEQTQDIEGFLIFQKDGKLKTWQSSNFPE